MAAAGIKEVVAVEAPPVQEAVIASVVHAGTALARPMTETMSPT